VILRVLQETLVDIHCHAEARCIFVILKCGAKALRLHVSDDGKGMSEAAGGIRSLAWASRAWRRASASLAA
jgi:signal transduction histidine kinase